MAIEVKVTCELPEADRRRNDRVQERGLRRSREVLDNLDEQLPRLQADGHGRRRAASLRQHLPQRRGHPLPEPARHAAEGRRRRLDPAGAGRRRPSPAATRHARTESMLDTIGNTPLVELPRFSPKPGVQLYAKLEGQNPTGSVKDRIAKYMIEAAERERRADARTRRSSSRRAATPASPGDGRRALKGYRVQGRHAGQRQRGARRSCCAPSAPRSSTADGRRRHERRRRSRRSEMVAEAPDKYFMPYQYGNENNPRAHYETTGPEILRDLPEIDVFVAGLGTGGTLTGAGRYLKEKQARREGHRRRAAPRRPRAGAAQPRRGVHPAGARRDGARRPRSSSTRARRSRWRRS